MANDKSKKPSRKTTTAKNKRKKTPTKADKEPTRTGQGGGGTSGGGGGFQRLDLDRGGMERLPSNAPTMAIAPSDYEHIFHEGAGAAAPPGSPQASPPPPPPAAEPDRSRAPSRSPQQDYGAGPQSPQAPPQPPASNDVQVTPDGYTLLGQPPLDVNSSPTRRVAFPSHIVRANNQFSRAALARVARYLAGRSEL